MAVMALRLLVPTRGASHFLFDASVRDFLEANVRVVLDDLKTEQPPFLGYHSFPRVHGIQDRRPRQTNSADQT
jgi:hypothetical protein